MCAGGRGVPVTGLLSPLTSVSPATSLLKTVVVSAHARRTAAMATCCSRTNGTGMTGVSRAKIIDNQSGARVRQPSFIVLIQ